MMPTMTKGPRLSSRALRFHRVKLDSALDLRIHDPVPRARAADIDDAKHGRRLLSTDIERDEVVARQDRCGRRPALATTTATASASALTGRLRRAGRRTRHHRSFG